LKYGKTAHNRTVYASPPVGGSGYVLARSIASLIPTPKLRHIFAALVLLRKPLFGLQKHRKQPERYAQLVLNLVDKNIGKYYSKN
jgi:hypothetical protein